jgi:hypothetical protein
MKRKTDGNGCDFHMKGGRKKAQRSYAQIFAKMCVV